MSDSETLRATSENHATRAAPQGTLRRRIEFVIHILQVRLRFVVLLAIGFAVVGNWQWLRNYWDKLTRTRASDPRGQPVSVDTEFFCPMDSGVVSGWPGKCGVCNMALVRRKKGDMVLLPEGVVSRMQLSPYRVQLAGIHTSLVEYRPLLREVVTIGRVKQVKQPESGERGGVAAIEAQLFERDVPYVSTGQQVHVSVDGDSNARCDGTVGPIDQLALGSHIWPIQIEIADPPSNFRAGVGVTVRIRIPAADLEPFRSMPRSAPPIDAHSVRRVFVCAEHPEVVETEPGKCPVDETELQRRPLAENQRVVWWCPMHPQAVSDATGADCRECNGMKLIPRVVTFAPVGQVLAVPESAVIDTGMKKVVYIERSPGIFDGVEVMLGLRCGDSYPVIQGLEPGHRVATTGAFLIDAETRLNPSIAAGYFGATTASSGAIESKVSPANSRGPQQPATAHPGTATDSQLSRADADRAAKQKTCPVSGAALGTMGIPKRVEINALTVFLCCEGCEAKLRENPEKFLARLKQSNP